MVNENDWTSGYNEAWFEAKQDLDTKDAEITRLRETIRRIRKADNMTCVWHIADAALQK